MASNRGTVRNVLDEIHEMRDWIPLTGAPGANDINANCAGREEVLELVECIFSDSRVYTGTIEPDTAWNYLTRCPPMVTPADLVPYIFSPGPEDPASVMMGYFVAEYEC